MPRETPRIAILGHEEGDGFLPFFEERVVGRFELVGVGSAGLSERDGEVAHESVSLDDLDFAVIRDLGDPSRRDGSSPHPPGRRGRRPASDTARSSVGARTVGVPTGRPERDARSNYRRPTSLLSGRFH